jgi:chemotaxis protein CheD
MKLETQHAEFTHIRRMRDSRFPHEIASILPGEYFVSEEPMIVYTVLGSCISACIRDPIAGVGGMNHFMLPEPKEHGSDSWGESTRYGSFAMESLINDILKRGGLKSRLEVKLFGAGKIYEGQIDPRKVYYFTESGRVLVKKIERIKNQTIMNRETEYASKIQVAKQQPKEDVTLF